MTRINALDRYAKHNKKVGIVVSRIMAWDHTIGLRANAKALKLKKEAACSFALKYDLKHCTKVGRPRK